MFVLKLSGVQKYFCQKKKQFFKALLYLFIGLNLFIKNTILQAIYFLTLYNKMTLYPGNLGF